MQASDLALARTPADLGRQLELRGDAWEAAIEMGIDVTLLLSNLDLSPCERLARATEHLRFADAVQQRTVPAELRDRLERIRLWAKIDALGGPDPSWPEDLRAWPDDLRDGR